MTTLGRNDVHDQKNAATVALDTNIRQGDNLCYIAGIHLCCNATEIHLRKNSLSVFFFNVHG
jgi:hypothetical protein